MIKEIKYGGFTANPNDHGSIEGDLAVAMNLIPEDGTVKPVFPPKRVADIPWDAYLGEGQEKRILCIHRTSAYTHYIVGIRYPGQYGTSHFWYLYAWDGTDNGQLTRIGDISYPDIYKVEPIGNTLVVLASDGIHYILWKAGGYKYLGTHIPELDLQFWLSREGVVYSDTHSVDLETDGSNPSIPSITNNKELSNALRQAIMASANQAVAKAIKNKHFVFPFFVRYAFRMYDGSVTMHSAPMLMIPTMDMPKVWRGFTDDGFFINEPYKTNTMAQVDEWSLMFRVIDGSQFAALEEWQDIVTDIDVCISPQFYTYNQAAEDEKIDIFNEPHLEKKDITRDVCENGSFFLAKSIPLKKIGPYSAGVLDIDFEPSNDNIVVRERMTDDYGTHDGLIAAKSYAYNNRINLASVSKRLFNGFNPLCFWWRYSGQDDAVISHYTRHYVVVEEDGREIIMESPAESVIYVNNNIVWYFYPNANAKRVYIQMDNGIVMLQLTAHSTLNGAYYCSLDTDLSQQVMPTGPTPSADDERIVSTPNKVYTSEVNNPFYFPSTGINSISSGNIMGICAAVRPVSSGQYGYADLYIFADNGIWTAKINDKGTYGNLDYATGDVCINPDSITQMETSVLFTTARGIMLISGSQAQCISDAIDDKGQVSQGLQEITTNLADMMSVLVEVDYFDTFLQGCRMLYDYRGQRIIVYNKDYSYAYIYSLESNKWGMAGSDIKYTVNSYPDALAVTEGNKLVNYSEPCSVDDGIAAVDIGQLLLTRPLTLDQPDIIKTVTAVLQRGMFPQRKKHVQCVLYGSRDLYNWRVVSSSRDEIIRGFSGTGYKWFRVGLLLHLERGESITGCTVEFNPRQTNRLR